MELLIRCRDLGDRAARVSNVPSAPLAAQAILNHGIGPVATQQVAPRGSPRSQTVEDDGDRPKVVHPHLAAVQTLVGRGITNHALEKSNAPRAMHNSERTSSSPLTTISSADNLDQTDD